MEQIKISTKTNKEAIEVLESAELSARVSTSELYSMENVFLRFLGIVRIVGRITNPTYVQVVGLSVSIVDLIAQMLTTTHINSLNWFILSLLSVVSIKFSRSWVSSYCRTLKNSVQFELT